VKAGGFDAAATAIAVARITARRTTEDQAENGVDAEQLADMHELLDPLDAGQLRLLVLHLASRFTWALETAVGLEQAQTTLDDLEIEGRWQADDLP
jgi:hypothetical protein